MGILQKNKRGTKGARRPIPVLPCWAQRIEASPREAPDTANPKEAVLLQRLSEEATRLSAEHSATWLEQSKHLKAIEKHLVDLEKIEDMSEPTLGFVRSVLVPLAVECFFLPSDVTVRRQAIPLIKVLSSMDPSAVNGSLRQHLLAFINKQCDDSSVDTATVEEYAKHGAGHQAQALQTLVGISVGLPVVRRMADAVLAHIAGSLEDILPQLHEPSSSLGSAERVAMREDCTHVIRLAFLVISKFLQRDGGNKQAVCNLHDEILAALAPPAAAGCVRNILAHLYGLCWSVVGCDGAMLEAREVAAMVLVALISGSGMSAHDRAVALARRTLDMGVSEATALPNMDTSYLPEIDDSEHRARCLDDAVSMVCVARAIVSFAPYETTLLPLDIVPSAKYSGVVNTVHEAVFTHIASVCGRSQLAPGVKVVVFESMAVWLQETAKLLMCCVDEYGSATAASESVSRHTVAFALGQRVLVLQRERIMGYLWSYWDDPLDAVQAKVKVIFEAFLDIGSAMSKAVAKIGTLPGSDNSVSSDSNAFLNDVLDLVLTMDWSRKVKYSLLATLCSRIDIFLLFKRQPDLLEQCFVTLAQVMMAPRVAALFSAILIRCDADVRSVRNGTPGDGLTDSQRETAAIQLEGRYMDLWVTSVISALCKDDDNIRRMLAKHVCPNLFRTFPRIVTEILKSLTHHLAVQQQEKQAASASTRKRSMSVSEQTLEASRQHALIIVLKVARSLDLITIGQLARVDSELEQQTGQVKLSEGTKAPLMTMLNQAVFHPDWSVRADMLGLLCEARRLSTPLSGVEFDLLFKLLRVSSNATSADFRQQQYSALTMLATRLVSIATHAHRIATTGKPPVPSQKVRHREKAKRDAAVALGLAQGKTEEQVLRELGILSQDEMVAQAKLTLEGVERAVNQWVDLAVRGCLYPGAGFAKVAMGLKWLDILTRFFTPGRPAQAPDDSMVPFTVQGLSSPDFEQLMSKPDYRKGGANVTANEVIPVLTHVLLDDPFDTNRSSAFALLTEWPLVPAGSVSAEKAAKSWADSLLRRALHLVNNTRAGESESGALIIRWLFRKFVILQGIPLSFADAQPDLPPIDSSLPHDLVFVTGLLAMIRRCQDAAAKNLLDAAQNYPLHGLLTAAHYVAEEVEFESRSVQQNAQLWKQWLADLSGSAIDISNIVLGVLTSASPEGNIPSSFREMETKIDEIIKSSTAAVDAGTQMDIDDDGDEDDEYNGDVSGLEGPVGPRQQVILSYCWRAIKEVAGLLAVVATSPPGTDLVHDGVQPLVDESTVGEIGDLLRTLLTSIRHRGAFSAVHPAFTDVCRRLYHSSNAELSRKVAQWLEQCLDIVTICQVSVTRRSAGWPLCLLSILTCDMNATQALLPRAMDRIFALATDLRVDVASADDAVSEDPETDGTVDLPQVHAINMLRVLLDDKTLASDIVPYIEHAYVLSLTGLRSRHWAIRNVCGLLYAALTRRVFGANKAREETIYDGITGRELFTRFPGLHPFLTNQLEDAVDQMAEADIVERSAEALQGTGGDDESEFPTYDPIGVVMRSGARLIHPALYPCLILLARLQPSPKELERPDNDTPEPFAVVADPAPLSASAPLDMPSSGSGHQRQPSQAEIAASIGVLATSPHAESATGAVAPPMNLDQEPLTKVNERNSTVHVTSASTMLSMYSFTELVEMCVDSPVFKTREMAARAFAPLIPGDKAVSVVVALLKSIRQNGDGILTNSCHGILCQVQELLRVHWRQGNSTDAMRRAFVMQVFPAVTSLWPSLIQNVDDGHYSQSADDVSDMVRFKYLCIINEYVSRGEDWLLVGTDDLSLIKTTKLVLSRFRISILYGFLHPLFSHPSTLARIGDSQIPGAFGTLQELTKLLLACIDDTTAAVMQDDGTVQLEVDTGMAVSEGRQVSYNPWAVFENILGNNEFYEAKLELLDWLIEHISTGQVEIFERIGILNLLSYLVVDAMSTKRALAIPNGIKPALDPLVRSKSILLLAVLCTRLDIDAREFPISDLIGHWDDISRQLSARFCPLSVATSLVQYQGALLHLLQQCAAVHGDYALEVAHKRSIEWATFLLKWTDPERAVPYRDAVSKAVIRYSMIKRYYTGPDGAVDIPLNPTSEEILRICFWRLLQDDDEDIREFIAKHMSRRLGRELACDQACEQVIDMFSPLENQYPHMLIGHCFDYLQRTSDGKEIVQTAVNPNRRLFEHENPNIYIDEFRNFQLAYRALVNLSKMFEDSPTACKKFVDRGMQCMEALSAAHEMLLAAKQEIGENGVEISGTLGVTSLPVLFSHIQSWILGARVAIFAASRMRNEGGAESLDKVRACAEDILSSGEIQPLHPWVLRSLHGLHDLAQHAIETTEPVSKDAAMSDLYLLTCVE